MNYERIKKYADDWAFDLEIQLRKSGEIKNVDVINQSIELILMTLPGERLFNPSFGSNFQLRLFDNMTEEFLERLLDDTVVAISRWEDRIIIIEPEVRLNINPDGNSAFLFIPYIIKERQLKAAFQRKITQ